MANVENSFDVFRYTSVPREEVRRIFGEALRKGFKKNKWSSSTYNQFTEYAPSMYVDLPEGFYEDVSRGNYNGVNGKIFNHFRTPLNLTKVRNSVFRQDFSEEEKREILTEAGRRNFLSLGPRDEDSKLLMLLQLALVEQL